MSAHIIGRPTDDLLDLILGPGADPEQAFIGGCEKGLEDKGRLLGEKPNVQHDRHSTKSEVSRQQRSP